MFATFRRPEYNSRSDSITTCFYSFYTVVTKWDMIHIVTWDYKRNNIPEIKISMEYLNKLKFIYSNRSFSFIYENN